MEKCIGPYKSMHVRNASVLYYHFKDYHTIIIFIKWAVRHLQLWCTYCFYSFLCIHHTQWKIAFFAAVLQRYLSRQ